jgi:hypothetical protein
MPDQPVTSTDGTGDQTPGGRKSKHRRNTGASRRNMLTNIQLLQLWDALRSMETELNVENPQPRDVADRLTRLLKFRITETNVLTAVVETKVINWQPPPRPKPVKVPVEPPPQAAAVAAVAAVDPALMARIDQLESIIARLTTDLSRVSQLKPDAEVGKLNAVVSTLVQRVNTLDRQANDVVRDGGVLTDLVEKLNKHIEAHFKTFRDGVARFQDHQKAKLTEIEQNLTAVTSARSRLQSQTDSLDQRLKGVVGGMDELLNEIADLAERIGALEPDDESDEPVTAPAPAPAPKAAQPQPPGAAKSIQQQLAEMPSLAVKPTPARSPVQQPVQQPTVPAVVQRMTMIQRQAFANPIFLVAQMDPKKMTFRAGSYYVSLYVLKPGDLTTAYAWVVLVRHKHRTSNRHISAGAGDLGKHLAVRTRDTAIKQLEGVGCRECTDQETWYKSALLMARHLTAEEVGALPGASPNVVVPHTASRALLSDSTLNSFIK